MLKVMFITLFAWQAATANIISTSNNDSTHERRLLPSAIYDTPKKWWEHANFYQLYPRSFMDSNSDGIGDIPGMIAKLDHLKDLGITAAWLSPVMKSPQHDLGYDISNYREIEPDYGTMANFEELVQKCHALGIKLLLDFIPNHTSDEHEWFIKSEASETKYMDYYIWKDGKNCRSVTTEPPTDPPTTPQTTAATTPPPTAPPNANERFEDEIVCDPPNNWISVFGGPAWTWSDKRQQFYLHQFTKHQPDLNYHNAEVVAEMTDVMKFYLDKGVDGFRLDAINHMFEDPEFRDEEVYSWPDCVEPYKYDCLNHNYTKDLDQTFDQVYKWREFLDKYTEEQRTDDKILFTEAYTLNIDNTMRFYRSNEEKPRLGAHMPFNFQLIYAFGNDKITARELKNSLDYWFTNVPAGFVSNWVVGSHDHSRIASRFGNERIELANAIMFALPGTSVSYYGEECGMTDNEKIREEGEKTGEWKHDARDPNRTPMQWSASKNAGFSDGDESKMWLAIPDNYMTVNVEAVKNKEGSIYWQFIDLTKLRATKTMIYGDINIKVINEEVIAFTRELLNHETYVLVSNLQRTRQDVDLTRSFATLPDKLKVVFKTFASQYKKEQEIDATAVVLQPYDALILRADFNSATTYGISIGLIVLAVLRQMFF